MVEPKISAVVIHYRAVKKLEAALRSIQQRAKHCNEIIVVDDCTPGINFQALKSKYPQVKFFQTANNIGPAGARNLGLSKAENDLVLHMDCDVTLGSNAVENLVRASEGHPEITFLTPLILSQNDKKTIRGGGSRSHYLGLTLTGPYHKKKIDEVNIVNKKIFYFGGGCFLINRRNKNLEGFDTNFFYSLEELDFIYRNRIIHDHQALLVSNALVYHKPGTTPGLSFNPKQYGSSRFFQIHRNHLYFLLKNYQFKTLIILLPLFFLFEAAFFLFSILKVKDKLIYFKSWLSLINNFPKLVRKRSYIQKNRILNDRQVLKNYHLSFNSELHEDKITDLGIDLFDKIIFNYGRYVLGLK